MGQKVVLWVKKRCLGVFWTECEVAGLKQRQRTTTMDHRNKIQSLVLPTDHDDHGDAPDCITEYGPCIWPDVPYSTDRTDIWGFCRAEVGFSLPGAARTAGEYASYEIWPAAREPRKALQWARRKLKNNFFEKCPQISVLDEGDCQTAWFFAYWGPFGCQRRAWPHAADSPHFHMHRENWPIFRSMGLLQNQRWITCRWSPEYPWEPSEHPRDTSHECISRYLPPAPNPPCTVVHLVILQTKQAFRRTRGVTEEVTTTG